MRRTLSLALLASSCHATTALEPPEPAPGARSMLLIVDAIDGQPTAYGIDVPADGSAPVLPTFTRPAEIDLTAVSFACPLDVLGLKHGRQILLEEESDRLELPAPTGIATSHDGAVQSGWEPAELAAIEPVLKSIELPEENLCRLFGVSFAPPNVNFRTGTSTPTGLIPLQNGNVLVANTDGEFHELDPDRNERKLGRLTPDTPNGSGFLAADGTIWIVDQHGDLAHGDPELGMEIIPASGSTLADFAISDGAKFGPPEIFRASLSTIWERYDGVSWARLTDATGLRRMPRSTYGTVWLGPNEALASGVVETESSLVHYQDGDLEEIPMPEDEFPTALVQLPGIGLVVGTLNGVIIREEDGDWTLDLDSKIEGSIRNIIPTENGFIYGRSSWASWDPVAGYCRIDTPGTNFIRAVPIQDRAVLLYGVMIENLAGYLSTFERTDVRDPCLGK